MKMADVKVGMKLKSKSEYDIFSPITVTEITENGFKYTHEPRTVKIGYTGPIPQFGTCSGGEHYAVNGEVHYEELTQTDFSI